MSAPERKGFRYHVSDEQIREFRKLPAVDKLRVLQGMQRLAQVAAPDAAKRLWERFRSGEI